MWLVGAITPAAVAWCCLPPPPPLLGHVSFSRRVVDRHGQLLSTTLTADEKFRVFTPLAQISPEFIAATLLHEDRHFWYHPGVNPIALGRAAWHAIVRRDAQGGASTISMQLARMRFGIHSRTASGKLIQIFRAFQLERHHPKSEILEAYLNLAPYGGNIEGIGAASLLLFGKPPAKLTLHEAITLSVVPQSPRRRGLHTGNVDRALSAAKARLYARLAPHYDAQFSGRDFLPRSAGKRATAAPHFVRRVLETPPGTGEIRTTLDSRLQRLVERGIASHLQANGRLGVRNAAALLVDTRQMQVLAQVGSAGFFNDAISGQVDGTRSRRSPGSALKPFVYALAIDQGVIHPLTVLKDTPQSFSGYNPENFDGEFAGPIRAGEALARSRNVPAVWLASQLTKPSFFGFLARAGLALPRGEGFYGLTLPLGGAEVTMEELVRLYAALANDGQLRELTRVLPSEAAPAQSGVRLVSPEAAFLTLEMLGQSPPPGANETSADQPVFWKTGTSHGFRDAWSIAVFDRYVLAVWIGNFDGSRNPAFVGRTCAAPLLFRLIDAMRGEGHVQRARHEPPAGANLRPVEFCALSGQLPNGACTARASGWFMPGVTPISICEVHRELIVDDDTGLRLPMDDGTRSVRREVHEVWPSDLLALFEKAGLPRRRPPPFLPDAASGGGMELRARDGQGPQIVSPAAGGVYVLRDDADSAERGIALKARTEGDVAKLYWFAGKSFLGAASPRETILWRPSPGAYQVVALDDHGRASTAAVTLQAAER